MRSTPRDYLLRAEEFYACADNIENKDAREGLIALAQSYELMAARISAVITTRLMIEQARADIEQSLASMGRRP